MPAFRVYNDILNKMDHAINLRDADLWCEIVEFPHKVHTEKKDFYVTTREQHIAVMDGLRETLVQFGAERIQRVVECAEFLTENKIRGHHVAYMMADGVAQADPIASRLILERGETGWKIAEVTNALEIGTWPFDALQIADGLVSETAIERRQQIAS
ncbi:hypothetical protein [Shimia ponticola]|uniref:hypothetical protein n=1 Tax=Shimia ponticola TaxID=2582893 RepID=UPI0011BE219C|nr:hypothetical protein [Shimia ponticola]